MMPRLQTVFMMLILVGLAACAQNEPEAALLTSQETPDTPPVATTPIAVTGVAVEVTRSIGTPEPGPTPVECTSLSEGMTLTVVLAAGAMIHLELTGLQPGESPHLLFTQEKPDGLYQMEEWGMSPVGEDGRFTYTERLSSPYDYPDWQGKIIHARGVACFEFSLPLTEAVESGRVENGRFLTAPVSSMLLSLADYPPGETPYFITEGDFWLVHTPAGQLIAFAATSPDYRPDIGLDACRFTWAESVGRFVDPCSGDEWTLDGRFSLAHSSERWSDRDLDQYRILRILEEEGTVNVQIEISKNQSADQPKGWNQSQEQTGE
jgi:hypothetical protein